MDYPKTNDHYYRERCQQLSQQLHETKHRHRNALREVRRSKVSSTLMKKLLRLRSAHLSADKIAERVLSALYQYMSLDCCALYSKSSTDGGFRTLAYSGFAIDESCDLSRKKAMPEFACVDSSKDNLGVSRMLEALTHTSSTLWCFNPGTGLALVLGSNRLHEAKSWQLTSDDREMLHTILELVANAINEAQSRIEPVNPLIDEMTGLATRKMAMDFLERESRSDQRALSGLTNVMYLDVDHFGRINQQFGHAIGDRVLVAIAHRLKTLIRPGDLLARIGVDEFAIIASGVRVGCDAELISARILESFRKPFRVAGESFYVSISLGIAEASPNRTAIETFRDANVAMYKVKSSGGAGYERYGEEMRKPTPDAMRLETDLRRAVECQELSLYYQPIFSLHSNAVVALEALLRWHHPTKGTLTPTEFMPLAEKSEMGLLIGDWVLGKVIRDLNIWSSENEQSKGLSVCINVDESQFVQQDFVANLAKKLRLGGIDPQRIRLEIAELTLQGCMGVAKEVLTQLRDLGVKVMLDDFGTGSSSIERLHMLPIDTIKIDKNFVDKLSQGRRHSALIKAMVSLAKNLDKQIVAEGAENSSQLQQLKEMGCDFAQGYHFGKPMAASRIGQFIGNQATATGGYQA